ncbi:hypothetical protein B9Z55_016802 [Caenorhabditis nigoni]|uniref:Uncharacterized protein n=1 Tax=Caenorhabditis nigoni TaxID=1611254 RepID=A0A2G5T6A5_9PELO|nr:hypothetical protein B9Z55_016802 [Caenorhabditis nigoni]
MVVNLDLTEKTIDCFNECAKKGNYEKFVDENQKFIKTLSDNLKKVKFPVHEIISNMVSQNCKFYMDYLTKWNPRDHRVVVPGTTLLERDTPNLVEDLKRALSIRNWNQFYSEYYATADFIIKEARKQGVLDFQIEQGPAIFESFQERDLFVTNMQGSTNDEILEHQNTPLETKNSREMISRVEAYPESHQLEMNPPSLHSGTHARLSDNSTNGLHGSKKSDHHNRLDNSPGVRLRDVPISEQPQIDRETSSTSYENSIAQPYISLLDVYKNASLSSAPQVQHVHNTTGTNRTSQINRNAYEPLEDVQTQNPKERYSRKSPFNMIGQDSQNTIIPSAYKAGFSVDDALQNREFQGTRELLPPYKNRSLSNAPHNQHAHDAHETTRTTPTHKPAQEPPQDIPKHDSQISCSKQSPFNTIDQDSEHTVIQSEYKPGFSVDDALRAIETGMALDGSLSRMDLRSPRLIFSQTSAIHNPNQSISDYREDMNLATLLPQATLPIYESLNNSSSSREMSLCRDFEKNEAKKTELESKRKREMDDLKLWFEVRATAIEEKIDKICGEMRNEQNEANRRIEDKLNTVIETFNKMMLSTTTKSSQPTFLESIPEADDSHRNTVHVEREVNERVVDSTGANQVQQVHERFEIPKQVNLDVDPDGVSQEPHDSSEESEEEDLEQRLAEQNRVYGEKLKTIKERRNQLNV